MGERVTVYHCDGVYLCDWCLMGEGGECQTPGCRLCLSTAPDLPLWQKITDAGGTLTATQGD